jgi:hypothetical protein
MVLYWDPEHVLIHNDAFLPSLGDPRALLLARPAAEALPDFWPLFGPRVEYVMKMAESVWDEDCCIALARRSRVEETYWTYSLTPVFEEGGTVGACSVRTWRRPRASIPSVGFERCDRSSTAA